MVDILKNEKCEIIAIEDSFIKVVFKENSLIKIDDVKFVYHCFDSIGISENHLLLIVFEKYAISDTEAREFVQN